MVVGTLLIISIRITNCSQVPAAHAFHEYLKRVRSVIQQTQATDVSRIVFCHSKIIYSKAALATLF